MFSRAVLPLTRQRILASSIRRTPIVSAHQTRSYAKNNKPKAPYELPDSIKQAKGGSKPKATTPQQEYSSEQVEFDTNAEPKSNTEPRVPETDPTQPEEAAPRKPLPDLTQGIPSTLAAELDGRRQGRGAPSLNLTEDPSREEDFDDAGGRGNIPKDGYVSSADRRKDRVAKIIWSAVLLGGIAGTAYLGRNWESEEEEKAHTDAPSGWGIGLMYNRIKARMNDITSYYKDPAFPKLLPDVDPQFRPPYTLVISLEDLLVHSEWSREHGWRVAKRPGVDYFLRYLSMYYEIVLFTSVPSMMGQQVLRELDPFRFISWPLFREATKYKDGEYIKDLSYLNRDLSKLILVDTKEEHARLQPENAVIIPKWNGDPRDKTLVALIPFLEYLAGMNVQDVRTVIKSFDGTFIPVEFAKREKAMRERFEKELAEEQKKRPRRGVGSLAAALGIKPVRSVDGEPVVEGKMVWDQIREQGQKRYEMLEEEIRKNGAKMLAEMAAEEEKFKEEQMKSMTSSFRGMFAFGGGDDAKKE